MEWWLALLLTLGSLIFLLVLGIPVAFAFLMLNIVWVFILWGGGAGLGQLILNIRGAVTSFTLLPIILFVLMGDVIFRAGIAPHIMDALDQWLGRLPGRLSLLAVGGGTLLSTLTGTSMASCAMLGSTLVPEMEKRGYKKSMSLGPILGSSGLAIMIPPSGLAVLFGAIARVSIGRILMAIIIPGLVMAALYAFYIILRSRLQPSLAPPYDTAHIPMSDKLVATAQYILPLGFIIFLVTGVIFMGLATPTEAGATGALGCFILAAAYRRLNWKVVKESLTSTVEITVMMLMILLGAEVFSQIMAFTGAIRGLTELIAGFPLSPILILIGMQIVLLFLGMFIGAAAIMMITIPIYIPTITALGFNPVWFAVIYLLNMEMAATTPPYGLSLFVMKSVAPPDTTMGDIYRAGLPFLLCDVVVIALMLAFPVLSLWLPSVMR